MNVSQNLKNIFSHAVALDQSGRMKSEIHCSSERIYILNNDRTILIAMKTPGENKKDFNDPISFFANDYDSDILRLENGRVVFEKGNGSGTRTKVCRQPSMAAPEVKGLFEGFWKDTKGFHKIIVQKELLDLLDDNLSHIEFVLDENNEISLVQRDIFSGATVKVVKKKSRKILDMVESDSVHDGFSPVGIRTVDMAALFSFYSPLTFSLQPEGNFFLVKSLGDELKGVVATCLYDDLGTIHGGMEDGRKKPKDGRRFQEPDRKPEEPTAVEENKRPLRRQLRKP